MKKRENILSKLIHIKSLNVGQHTSKKKSIRHI